MFKKIIPITIVLTFFLSFVSAANAVSAIDITLNQQTFQPDDKIEAQVTFSNTFSQAIIGRLFCSFASLNGQLSSPSQIQEINLSPGQKSQPFSCSMSVGTTMPQGPYRVQVTVQDDNRTVITSSYKDFLVTGTLKSIEADLLVCADAQCQNNKKVFIQGETVYLKLKTYLTGLRINALLDGRQTIDFSNNLAQVKAEQQGSYIINLTLDKDGYAQQVIQTDFAVIDQPAQIVSTDDEQPWSDKNKLYIIIAIILAVLIIILVFIIIRKIYVRRSNQTTIK